MRRRAALLGLALAAALAGCADLRWSKPGADDAAMAGDLAACDRLAQERAARAGNLGLPPLGDPRFGGPGGPSQVEQRMLERQALEACMRAKGYRLAPPAD